MQIKVRLVPFIFLFFIPYALPSLSLSQTQSYEPIPYEFIYTKEQQAAFIQKHLIDDEEVKNRLDSLYLSLASSKPEDIEKSPLFHSYKTRPYHLIGQLSILPDYFLKMMRRTVGIQYLFTNKDDIDSNLYRIIEGQRFKECISRYRLNLLHIPDKKLYHVPGADWSLNDDNYLVLSKKMPIFPSKMNYKMFKNLSMAHKDLIDQLFTLILLTGFDDPHRSNVCFLSNSPQNELHVSIIDTGVIELARKKRDFLQGKGAEMFNKAVKRGLSMFRDCLNGQVKVYWEEKMDHILKQYFK